MWRWPFPTDWDIQNNSPGPWVRDRVLAATTTHGAFTEAEGGVVWVGQGTVNLALPPFGAGEETMALVAELFDVAQLSPVVRDDAASMVWEKVLLNLAINPIAALAGLQNGELLADELLSTCMMVYREAARVRACSGSLFPTRLRLNTTCERS